MTTRRILIVDDDANYGLTLARIFQRKGYDVSTADNGFKALELVQENIYDAVLMDIKMPVINGVETFKKMKEIRPDLTVILMTAYSIDDLIRDAVKEGVYAAIRKPFDIDTVINMIRKSREGLLLAVVDDDPNICRSMKATLERTGYSVTTCATGEDALAIARERAFDVVFIDVKMPSLNGLEIYLELKRLNPGARVVMMTAYRDEVDDLTGQAQDAGVYACLYKPFDMDRPLAIIEEILSRRD